MVSYAVQLATRYDGLVIATFPDLPGVTALGSDHDEALHEARRALDEALAGYATDGVEPPAPAAKSGTMVSPGLTARPIPA
ncbi:type II toxin-antitoxin system HicB family antitoxin [Sphingosinicella sp. LHD-64]|uniref:type II toxin-antitoxin system HicB family antitoxin n=1 Tax=Sphingosinicella sp. LHD-64 TaxID=3072139 RepID=UPI00280DC99C|nr:type II toxin-antitoxin system HicB family antitoxin [Sphingosinicella sp. LHD-64]MDQ8757141.1 type II toxin-antitoxin system HicB family antitoxin [Sphingosinicella sp. LHD-64]